MTKSKAFFLKESHFNPKVTNHGSLPLSLLEQPTPFHLPPPTSLSSSSLSHVRKVIPMVKIGHPFQISSGVWVSDPVDRRFMQAVGVQGERLRRLASDVW
ncbi:hypothetical protein L1987_84174 [Smallanthus sonchifolius]|uniref:Uncharacterized protein n=1 Tax=Smallanthus sonchifolius TaxID=185202 RepID=A0ACB8YEM9_9ASTR|nr:hypothetical protein L1987_84174 [Smallanthus sonchifolius]